MRIKHTKQSRFAGHDRPNDSKWLALVTGVARLCPGIVDNDESCDSQLSTLGGGVYEKKRLLLKEIAGGRLGGSGPGRTSFLKI